MLYLRYPPNDRLTSCTYLPTYLPTNRPAYRPAYRPTGLPSYLPTDRPKVPTYRLSDRPTDRSTDRPAYVPTYLPTDLMCLPTDWPTDRPTDQPAYLPIDPTDRPNAPTHLPTYTYRLTDRPTDPTSAASPPCKKQTTVVLCVFCVCVFTNRVGIKTCCTSGTHPDSNLLICAGRIITHTCLPCTW